MKYDTLEFYIDDCWGRPFYRCLVEHGRKITKQQVIDQMHKDWPIGDKGKNWTHALVEKIVAKGLPKNIGQLKQHNFKRKGGYLVAGVCRREISVVE